MSPHIGGLGGEADQRLMTDWLRERGGRAAAPIDSKMEEEARDDEDKSGAFGRGGERQRGGEADEEGRAPEGGLQRKRLLLHGAGGTGGGAGQELPKFRRG